MVLIDTASGAVRADLDICNGAEDVFFDDRRQLIYVNCGVSVVDVFERSNDQMRRVARLRTASGARTAQFVPDLDRLFAASRVGWGADGAKISVFWRAP